MTGTIIAFTRGSLLSHVNWVLFSGGGSPARGLYPPPPSRSGKAAHSMAKCLETLPTTNG